MTVARIIENRPQRIQSSFQSPRSGDFCGTAVIELAEPEVRRWPLLFNVCQGSGCIIHTEPCNLSMVASLYFGGKSNMFQLVATCIFFKWAKWRSFKEPCVFLVISTFYFGRWLPRIIMSCLLWPQMLQALDQDLVDVGRGASFSTISKNVKCFPTTTMKRSRCDRTAAAHVNCRSRDAAPVQHMPDSNLLGRLPDSPVAPDRCPLRSWTPPACQLWPRIPEQNMPRVC